MKDILTSFNSKKFKYFSSGDSGIQFTPKSNDKNINSIFLYIKKYPPIGFLDVIPSLENILLVFDPKITSFIKIIDYLENNIFDDKKEIIKSGHHWEVPICYDVKYGLDLNHISKTCKLDPEYLIHLHLNSNYTVNMMGFLPGLPFLGYLDNKLNISRRLEPRKMVSSGSVGIALRQCVIYPKDTPGGWNLIGKTPISIFDHRREKPILFSVGDTMKFVKISSQEFIDLHNQSMKNPLKVNYMKKI